MSMSDASVKHKVIPRASIATVKLGLRLSKLHIPNPNQLNNVTPITGLAISANTIFLLDKGNCRNITHKFKSELNLFEQTCPINNPHTTNTHRRVPISVATIIPRLVPNIASHDMIDLILTPRKVCTISFQNKIQIPLPDGIYLTKISNPFDIPFLDS